jgi:hypothetical protein
MRALLQRAADRDLTTVIPIVLLVVLAVLVWLLRALVAPLLLLATVVLSYFAALGASNLLFEHVLDFAGVVRSRCRPSPSTWAAGSGGPDGSSASRGRTTTNNRMARKRTTSN